MEGFYIVCYSVWIFYGGIGASVELIPYELNVICMDSQSDIEWCEAVSMEFKKSYYKMAAILILLVLNVWWVIR